VDKDERWRRNREVQRKLAAGVLCRKVVVSCEQAVEGGRGEGCNVLDGAAHVSTFSNSREVTSCRRRRAERRTKRWCWYNQIIKNNDDCACVACGVV